jgi:hypothetical protein
MNDSAEKADEIYAVAKEAYFYAYPIVSMDVTMRQATSVPDANSVNRAPINQFAHVRSYPKADEKDVAGSAQNHSHIRSTYGSS